MPVKGARTTVTGLAVVTLGATITGCGGNNESSPSPSASAGSTTSSPASSQVAPPSPGQTTDYSALLIKPADIGGDFAAPQPPVLNPNNAPGVAQLFANADNSRRIGDTILIVADPSVAASALDNTKTNYASKVGGAWQPIDVGSNGALAAGTSPDNVQAVTVLLFTEGKALVNLEFDSAPTDPIDSGLVTEIGRRQDAVIKAGLLR